MYQIGGQPGHRAAEHLFSMKSVMALFEVTNKPLIIQVYDLSKYFDKEVLYDVMDVLYQAGIKGWEYRTYFKLSERTQIRVRMGSGHISRVYRRVYRCWRPHRTVVEEQLCSV